MEVKVSVITATYNRHDLLVNRCIPSVEAQTYSNVEHIIVSDGPEEETENISLQLGRNWRSFSNGESFGAIPRLVGAYMATGDYICYLDDDNEYEPEHVERLVEYIEKHGVDFVYSQMKTTDGIKIGSTPPRHGTIDTNLILHKAELLNTATWRPSGYADDWDIVERWLDSGATWKHLPEVTVKYYVH